MENEDYDKAKLKKVQMEEYRLQMYKQLEIHELLQNHSVSSLGAQTQDWDESDTHTTIMVGGLVHLPSLEFFSIPIALLALLILWLKL